MSDATAYDTPGHGKQSDTDEFIAPILAVRTPTDLNRGHRTTIQADIDEGHDSGNDSEGGEDDEIFRSFLDPDHAGAANQRRHRDKERIRALLREKLPDGSNEDGGTNAVILDLDRHRLAVQKGWESCYATVQESLETWDNHFDNEVTLSRQVSDSINDLMHVYESEGKDVWDLIEASKKDDDSDAMTFAGIAQAECMACDSEFGKGLAEIQMTVLRNLKAERQKYLQYAEKRGTNASTLTSPLISPLASPSASRRPSIAGTAGSGGSAEGDFDPSKLSAMFHLRRPSMSGTLSRGHKSSSHSIEALATTSAFSTAIGIPSRPSSPTERRKDKPQSSAWRLPSPSFMRKKMPPEIAKTMLAWREQLDKSLESMSRARADLLDLKDRLTKASHDGQTTLSCDSPPKEE